MLGEIITYETRRESHEKVDKLKRYSQIEYILSRFPEGLTAKEIAVQMKALGFSNTDERNVSAPRLTEMSTNGRVEPFKKRICKYTNSRVSVYRLRERPKQMSLGDYLQ